MKKILFLFLLLFTTFGLTGCTMLFPKDNDDKPLYKDVPTQDEVVIEVFNEFTENPFYKDIEIQIIDITGSKYSLTKTTYYVFFTVNNELNFQAVYSKKTIKENAITVERWQLTKIEEIVE